MSGPRIGSLFSGYGGLDMGVQAVFGGELTWFVEYDKAPSAILQHHWPEVPNYGDVTTLDWATVPPIHILTAGYPCQPFSTAGKRKGSNDERHLWPYVLEAIRQLRPRVVVLENVRGHLTLGFDRVLGDLAEAGYDTDWLCLPASAAGAPHKRERVFIVAHPQDFGHEWAGPARDGWNGSQNNDPSVADTQRERGERWGGAEDLAGTPRGGSGEGDQRQWDGNAADDRGSASPDAAGARRARREDAGAGRGDARENGGRGIEPERVGGERPDWGQYAPAIERWESIVGRLAPAPAVHGRLAPDFVEWMMGLPAGHVSSVDIARSKKLKALGNGVVPQHAELALSLLVPQPHSLSTTERES